jgi:hypothetical protein
MERHITFRTGHRQAPENRANILALIGRHIFALRRFLFA